MIYLDHHATTPVDPAVLDAMLPYFTEHFGNAASTNHLIGRRAHDAVAKARAQIAGLIGAHSRDIAFTSGATESNNLALKGVAEAMRDRGRHLITLPTEHKSVRDSARHLEKQGWDVTFMEVDEQGFVDVDELAAAIRDDTVLVSVMWTNNESGVHQDIEAIGAKCRERGVYFHCDASQGLGYLPLDVDAVPVDLVSFTAHKIYGPKGVGAIYTRRRNPRVNLVAQMDGGGHENGLRSGTLNVPSIAGFGAAAEIMGAQGQDEAARLRTLRKKLYEGIAENGGIQLNGPALEQEDKRHPGNLNLSFDGVRGDELMLALSEFIAVSGGSACSSGSVNPSHVLTSMFDDAARAASSVRFGLGRHTTEDEIDVAIETVTSALKRLR